MQIRLPRPDPLRLHLLAGRHHRLRHPLHHRGRLPRKMRFCRGWNKTGLIQKGPDLPPTMRLQGCLTTAKAACSKVPQSRRRTASQFPRSSSPPHRPPPKPGTA